MVDLKVRQMAYARLFESDDGRIVLEDLMRFCRARESTFHPDSRVAAALDGRREVFLRIEDHLSLSADELNTKYGGQT